MENPQCPKCENQKVVKSGFSGGRQRYKCKKCNYYFSVNKIGKSIDKYYVVKALQLYIEGISYREIERILGVSHVSVMNWVKQYKIKAPENTDYRPTYKVLNHKELINFMSDKANLTDTGMLITELGDKFMVIKWERFKN
ncbi:IS1 family transposase [Litoribacter ruber]|uniref:IS1/IS1595 family N-terminal zinc-binding domain-containing protein n=1 Tax=Litoribacter ruber TaxID=702568 RepID=UPI001BDA5D22|nr:helix-turn-helix domain-containing protein [Litoribacter ruber]MBT0811205.1 IS1 family transposase [Litoribacter ruber]